jgi:zinc transport system substrate-binding protein
MYWKWNTVLVVLIGLLIGCSDSATKPSEKPREKPVICTVNYPLAYFARRIGGDLVEVVFPAPSEGDPAFWQPDSQAVATFQQADVILLNGAGYAKWAAQVSLPTSKCVDTSAAFSDKLIPIQSDTTHSHGPTGKHRHGNLAFTTWLDFSQATLQAQAIKEALVKLSPKNKATFENHFNALQAELLELDTQMLAMGKTLTAMPLIVSHPVYPYWARRYGLRIRAVHWEPEEMPTEEMWAKLKTMRNALPAQWMIWEGTPAVSIANKLKQREMGSVTFDPCGNTPDSGDFFTVMQNNIKAIRSLK